MLSFQLIRLLARLRFHYPLLFFIPWIVVGQLVNSLLLGQYFLAFSIGLGFLSYLTLAIPNLRKGSWLVVVMGFALGWISAERANSIRGDRIPNPQTSVLLYVDSVPRYRRVGGMEISALVLEVARKSQGQLVWSKLTTPPRILCRAPHLPWREVSRAEEASIFVAKVNLHLLERSRNPFSVDSKRIRDGYAGTCRIIYTGHVTTFKKSLFAETGEYIQKIVRESLGDTEKAGLVLSMALGTRDVLAERTERAFKNTGLAHLLVVSGYQVTLVYYLVFGILRRLSIRLFDWNTKTNADLPASVLGLLSALFFVWMVGIEGPTLRAGLSTLFVVISMHGERGCSMFHGILFSLLLMMVMWPCVYCEPGVQLTYGALLGIALAQGAGEQRGIWGYLTVCIFASLATSFVAVLWFERFSLWGFILNPILAPLLGAISCHGGLIGIFLLVIGADSSAVLLGSVGDILNFSAEIIRALAMYPWGAWDITGTPRAALLAFLLTPLLLRLEVVLKISLRGAIVKRSARPIVMRSSRQAQEIDTFTQAPSQNNLRIRSSLTSPSHRE